VTENRDLSKKVKKLHLVSGKLVESFFAGNYRSVFKGPGLEFDEVREYIAGDDTRFIDWNVSSRMGTPYTKTFREEREVVLQVLIDLSASLGTGAGTVSKQDTAGMIFALLAFAAVANNDRVGSLLFSDRIEKQIQPMKGNKHVLKQISQVLSFKPEGAGSDLALAFRTTVETMKRRGICVILSDFRAASYWSELTVLAQRHDVIAIRVTDPVDRKYPLSGLVELQDPETGETILGYGRSARFREEYAEFWEIERLNWLNGCRRIGVDTLEINTEDDVAVKLMEYFNRRNKRQ
jgi:uncharacterized protein (DUF58 family)